MEPRDDDKQQAAGGWSVLFGGAGQLNPQSQSQGGMSPTRHAEVKKAIRAAMPFGLPKSASSKASAAGASGASGTSVIQADAGNVSGREGSRRPQALVKGVVGWWYPAD